MTDLLNGDQIANDNLFDMHLSGARRELVGGARREADRYYAADASRYCRRTSADAGAVDTTSSFFGDLARGAKTMVLRPVNVCMVNACKFNFCQANGIMFSGPSAQKCLFRSRSHASHSGNPA
jgi:hypothetical protein